MTKQGGWKSRATGMKVMFVSGWVVTEGYLYFEDTPSDDRKATEARAQEVRNKTDLWAGALEVHVPDAAVKAMED